MASARDQSLSINMVMNSAISGANFLQVSVDKIHTFAKKVEKIDLLGATKFPLLDRNLKQLDNHLGRIRSQTAKISANPIRLDIQTSRNSLKEARKDMTAIEHDAKQVAFWTKKTSENLNKPIQEFPYKKAPITNTNNQTTNPKDKIRKTQKNNARDIGNNAMVGAAAAVSAIVLPVKASIDFESTMADISKVVDFSGPEDVKKFSNELLELSHTIPLRVKQLGEISASGGQLGIARNDILDFTTVVAKMSTAFDMSASDAGDSMAKLMNVYGGGIKGVTVLGDAINHLSNTSASKANDIVNVLGRIGGNAKVLNLSAVQASNLASAFLALGKPPEMVGTALNSMFGAFGNIEGQSRKFKSALASMGINAVKFQKDIRSNPQQAISDFLTTLNNMDKSEQTKISYNMFGKEFGDDMLLLSGGVEHYAKAIKSTANETDYLGSMQKEFETRAATTQNSLILLGNKTTEFFIVLGNTTLPFIKQASSYIGDLTIGMTAMTEKFPQASKWIFGLGAAFVVGSVALAGFGLVASGVGTALAVLTSPMSMVVLGVMSIATAGTFLYNKFESVKASVDSFFTSFSSGLSPVVEEFKGLFGGLFSSVGNLFSSLSPVFSVIGTVLDAVGINFSNLGAVISGVFSIALTPIKWVLNALTWMINLGTMVVNGWVLIGQVAGSIWSGITDAIKSPFVTLFVWIEARLAAIMGVVDKVKNIVTGVTNVGTAVKEKASDVWSGTKSFFGFGDEKQKEVKKIKPTMLKELPINNVDYKHALKTSSLKEIENPTLPLESASSVTAAQLEQKYTQLQNNNTNQKQVTQTITNQITVHASDGKIDYEDLKEKLMRAQKEIARNEQDLQFADVS